MLYHANIKSPVSLKFCILSLILVNGTQVPTSCLEYISGINESSANKNLFTISFILYCFKLSRKLLKSRLHNGKLNNKQLTVSKLQRQLIKIIITIIELSNTFIFFESKTSANNGILLKGILISKLLNNP